MTASARRSGCRSLPPLTAPPPPPPSTAACSSLRMFRSRRYNVPTNKYGVKAGQDQKFWEEHGWINEQDPRGWFHWCAG